jgi:hypothetical protein
MEQGIVCAWNSSNTVQTGSCRRHPWYQGGQWPREMEYSLDRVELGVIPNLERLVSLRYTSDTGYSPQRSS